MVEGGKWMVMSFNKEHNHDLIVSPSKARFFRSHRSITNEQKEMINMLSEQNISTSQIIYEKEDEEEFKMKWEATLWTLDPIEERAREVYTKKVLPTLRPIEVLTEKQIVKDPPQSQCKGKRKPQRLKPPAEKNAKKSRTCANCQKKGHNIRTCKELRLVDSSGECRVKSGSRWREVDAKRALWELESSVYLEDLRNSRFSVSCTGRREGEGFLLCCALPLPPWLIEVWRSSREKLKLRRRRAAERIEGAFNIVTLRGGRATAVPYHPRRGAAPRAQKEREECFLIEIKLSRSTMKEVP
ncbi:hypothetical protein ACMD2_10005 [Ananas comosus]|uniref:Protein FAR1-RELATED SEQUENCE n=1 Tax=Ananas comosus TaxID=4615 RepID=A0A199W4P8_ANACO|nr:hypothetical protein ACMD2_10005 [Ananas comosus]